MATILIVDDEPAIRALLGAVLQDTEHTVLEAADGMAAIDLARRQRPQVVLLDLALPGLSGIEVCRRLRQDPRTADAAVFLLTGFVQQSHEEAAREAGAAGFVTKPFSPAAILDLIEEALASPAPFPGAH